GPWLQESCAFFQDLGTNDAAHCQTNPKVPVQSHSGKGREKSTLRQPRAVSRLGASWLARRASTPLRATVRIRLSTPLPAMKDRPHRIPRWNRNGGFLVAVAGRSHACTHSEEAACGTNLCARQSAASSRALRGKVLAPGPRLLLHRGSLHVPTEIPAANSD